MRSKNLFNLALEAVGVDHIETESLAQGWKDTLFSVVENGLMSEEDLSVFSEGINSLLEEGFVSKTLTSGQEYKIGATEKGVKLYCQVVGKSDLADAIAERTKWLKRDPKQARRAAETADDKAEEEAEDAEETRNNAKKLRRIEYQVAQEGFADVIGRLFGFKGKGSSSGGNGNASREKTDAQILHEWIIANLKDGKLASKFTIKPGPVTVKGKMAALLYRNGQPVTNPLQEFSKDFQMLESLTKQLMPMAEARVKVLRQLEKDAEDNSEDIESISKAIMKYAPVAKDNVISKFRAPNYEWLGAVGNNWTANHEYDKLVVFVETASVNGKQNTATVQSFTQKDLDAYMALTAKLSKLYSVIAMSKAFEVLGIDQTDYPFRAYSLDLDDDPIIVLNQFSHDWFEGQNTYVLNQIAERIEILEDGIWTIIQNAVDIDPDNQ